jgi:non-ribosomal peptide synthetase component F
MALMAALAAALHEATGQVDLALATDVADRRHVAAEGLIGFFANPLLLRIDMSGVATGRAVVGRVRAACLEAFAHQHVPANLVAVGLPPVRCKLSWQPSPPVPPRIGRCTVEWGAATPPGLPYDLLFNLFRDGDGVAGAALHRPAALDPGAVEALVARMAALLETMEADPDATLGTLAAGALPPVATAAMLRRRTFS